MAQLTYAEFTTKYQSGYGLTKSTLSGAYRQYQLSGTLPGTTAKTTTFTTGVPDPADWPGTMPYQQWLEEQGFVNPKPPAGDPTAPSIGFGGAYMPPGTTPTTPTTPTIPTMPTIAPPTITPAPAVAPAPTVTPLTVTPAPPYEKIPEQIAFEEMYGGKLTDWATDPQGIPEEIQAQMIQRQTDTLKARETESIRVMTNNMERRGLTNSGLLYANTQAIKSNTSKTIAGAIADVQIKSALMKLASFENAMGRAGQFLDYLSTQSQLAYAPELATWTAQTQADFAAWQANTGGTLEQWRMKEGNKFATWQAEQMATMATWQGKLDLLKMEINQAYQTQNIELQAQLQSQLAEQQHGYNIELAEIELEAAQQAAKAKATGSLLGSVSGAVATIASGGK